MSVETAGFEPGEPPDINGDSLNRLAYQDYLEGLVLGDIGRFTTSASTLEESGYPLAEDDLRENAKAVEMTLLEGIENVREEHDEFLEDALLQGIRSYVFSGLEVDVGFLRLIAQLGGQDDRWLRRAIKPTFATLLEVADADYLSPQDYQRMKLYGRRTIYALGQYGLLKKFFRGVVHQHEGNRDSS